MVITLLFDITFFPKFYQNYIQIVQDFIIISYYLIMAFEIIIEF